MIIGIIDIMIMILIVMTIMITKIMIMMITLIGQIEGTAQTDQIAFV